MACSLTDRSTVQFWGAGDATMADTSSCPLLNLPWGILPAAWFKRSRVGASGEELGREEEWGQGRAIAPGHCGLELGLQTWRQQQLVVRGGCSGVRLPFSEAQGTVRLGLPRVECLEHRPVLAALLVTLAVSEEVIPADPVGASLLVCGTAARGPRRSASRPSTVRCLSLYTVSGDNDRAPRSARAVLLLFYFFLEFNTLPSTSAW